MKISKLITGIILSTALFTVGTKAEDLTTQQNQEQEKNEIKKTAMVKRTAGLYEKPRLNSKLIALIPKGEKVEILEDGKNFKKVRTSNFTGYVYFTAFLPEKKQDKAEKQKVPEPELKIEKGETKISKVEKIEEKEKPIEKVDTLKEYKKFLEPFSEKTVIQNPDNYHVVRISLKDVNKIQCKAKVESFVYSKEKTIEVLRSENKEYLFVKILPIEKVKKEGDTILESQFEYDDSPRELYVECGEKMFTLVMIPQDIPAQLIEIQSTPKVNKKNTEDLKEINEFEKYISEILLRIYRSDKPQQAGFELKEYDFVKEFKELKLVGRYIYFAGDHIIKEYLIEAKEDIDPLSEYMFLEVSKLPVAIMLSKHKLKKGDFAVLYIVEKN